MRYAVAYKRFEDDPMVFHKGNAICLFQQDEGTVEKLKQHYLTYVPVKKDAEKTYMALEKAISKEVGQPIRLQFNRGEPTTWKICACPKDYHTMFENCRGY